MYRHAYKIYTCICMSEFELKCADSESRETMHSDAVDEGLLKVWLKRVVVPNRLLPLIKKRGLEQQHLIKWVLVNSHI